MKKEPTTIGRLAPSEPLPSENLQSAEVLCAPNLRLFGPDRFAAVTHSSGSESVSVAAVLEVRRGICVGPAIPYIALAQRLGLEAHTVATTVRHFIRVRLGGTVRNVELLEGSRDTTTSTGAGARLTRPASTPAR